jgi:hypothetical protein
MARNSHDSTEETVPMSVLTSVLERLTVLQEQQTKIARAQLKNAPKRKVTIQEHFKKFPPKRLTRPVYQNNRLVDANMLSTEALALLDTLAPGRYGNGILTVARVGEVDQSRIHLLYSNKMIEQRMAFYIIYPSLNVLVEKVHAEMAARGIQPVNDPPPPFAVEDEVDDNEDEAAAI